MANGFDRQQFATALQGLGAGLTGQLTPFLAQQERQKLRQVEESKLASQKARDSEKERMITLFEDSQRGLDLANAGQWDRVSALADRRLQLLTSDFPEANPTDTQQFSMVARAAAQGDPQAQQAVLFKLQENTNIGLDTGILKPPKVTEAAAETRAFEALTKDLTVEQKDEAKLIKLGLSPRAVGNAIQTIASKGIAELVGDASATIKQREKFAELTGASRAKTIDKGFERMAKIDAGVRNIDLAINALNEGAGVGAIQRFLPSFKAASVALDNIQGLMALDVIGAVTFGALSKGELDLAKAIALPTGLDTPQLIQHLQDRKVAQQKLRDYFNEQIQFLDQGGTVAGFLRQKEREQGDDAPPGQQRNVVVDF